MCRHAECPHIDVSSIAYLDWALRHLRKKPLLSPLGTGIRRLPGSGKIPGHFPITEVKKSRWCGRWRPSFFFGINVNFMNCYGTTIYRHGCRSTLFSKIIQLKVINLPSIISGSRGMPARVFCRRVCGEAACGSGGRRSTGATRFWVCVSLQSLKVRKENVPVFLLCAVDFSTLTAAAAVAERGRRVPGSMVTAMASAW
jgi:hypothetical protein